MSRTRLSSVVTAVTALGYVATAWLHSTGYASINRLSQEAPADLRALAPALWLMFSLDLLVLGMILGVVALRPCTGSGRSIVAIAGLCPLGAAILQVMYLGFVPPTAILLGLTALSFVSAALLPAQGRAPNRGTPPSAS